MCGPLNFSPTRTELEAFQRRKHRSLTMRLLIITAAVFAHAIPTFSFSHHSKCSRESQCVLHMNDRSGLVGFSRRAFFGSAAAGLSILPLIPTNARAEAMPSVSVEEFETILKESAKSVQLVEFKGSKGDEVFVRLIDGTIFEITGVVDSPTDPRSPLKLVATLRGYKTPVKFSSLESALDGASSKKTKVYMNSRVQEAAIKEKEKRDRMAMDETERLAELFRREGQEAPLL